MASKATTKGYWNAGMALLAVLSLNSSAQAMVTPIGASVFPPIAFPFRDSSIVGARLNLFIGIHQSVYGIDLGGVGNMTDRGFGGLQIAGVFNRTQGDASIYGAQLAGLVNWNLNGSSIYGLQGTLGLNIDRGKSSLIGLGVGLLGNVAPKGLVGGAQIGIYNRAKTVVGLQIGVVNFAESLHGIQIGVVNINKAGPLPVFPVVNIGF